MQIDVPRHFGLTSDPFRAREGSAGAARPLTDREARWFIEDRLSQAGGKGVFTREAVDDIVAAAGGGAQRLRWLAGSAMLEAALGGEHAVTRADVQAAIAQAGLRKGAPGAIRSAAAASGPRAGSTARIPARTRNLPGFSLTKAAAAAMVAMGLILGVALMGPVSVNSAPGRRAVPMRAAPRAAQPGTTIAASQSPVFDATAEPPPLSSAIAYEPPTAAPPPPTMARASVLPVSDGRDKALGMPAHERAVPIRSLGAPAPPTPAFADAVAQDPDDPPAAPEAAPERVFLHFRPGDREAAAELARRLEARGWTVAALREVDAAVRVPNTRFFYEEDAAAARALADQVSDAIGEPARARDMRDYPSPPRPGTIELWLPPTD